MSKSHIINLTIINNTPFDFQYNDDYFQFGRLAENNNFPPTILSGQTAKVQCCESDGGLACSGWVKYLTQGKELFFCFSNPVAGKNGINLGLTNLAWNNMHSQYDNGITVFLPINEDNLWFTGHISSTDSSDNEARWEVNYVDLNNVILSNLQMDDVVTAFNNVSTNGVRQYYTCDVSPTNITGLALSHFKGISSFGEKLIFSHPNLVVPPAQNGKYIIADKITVSNQGVTNLTADTDHPGWVHPCSSQACGSFMALGIQATASNPSKISEIEIHDIRKTQLNQPMTLLGSIKRTGINVNGVGMTRELSGTYLVAAVDSNNLTIYRSSTTDLLGVFPDFEPIIEVTDFPESGAGLALITQKNGDIFLIALNSEEDSSNNHIALFKLDFINKKVNQVGTNKAMNIPGISDTITLLKYYLVAIIAASPAIGISLQILLNQYGDYLNSCFRWGKGVSIKDSINLEVYATDRNVIPLSSIPLVGSNKDFSLVKWQSNAKRWPNSGITVGITTANGYYLNIVNGGGLSGNNASITTDKTEVGSNEKFTIVVLDAVHGYFALQTANGQYLTAVAGGGQGNSNDPINTNSKVATTLDKLTLVEQPDQTFALKTSLGTYLSAVNGGGNSDPKQAINTNSTQIGDNERFGFNVINQK